MSDLIERAHFVVQLFRECDAIQLPHKPTEQVLTDMIDRIEAQAEEIERLRKEAAHMRSGLNDEAQACEQLATRTLIKAFTPQAARLRALAAYRATENKT